MPISVAARNRGRVTDSSVVKISCDMCGHNALAKCTTCGADVCCRHARMLACTVQCDRCYVRIAPTCLDCKRPSNSKCAACPQRLCKSCTRGCMVVHKACKRTPFCKDCAATVMARCGICKCRTCIVQKVSCACSGEIAVCSSCYAKSTIDCMTPDCLKICCSRCIVSTCRVCLSVHCTECRPAQTVTVCMAPGCKQPVCARCVMQCEACNAAICSDHTPEQDLRCSACVGLGGAE